MFNFPCSAIFFEIFYGFPINGYYLFDIILPYLETLHSSKMWVYNFLGLYPFNNIMDMPTGNPQYEKLNVRYSAKCDETFYNKIKSRFVNKKR
jgi:hypothetical protein